MTGLGEVATVVYSSYFHFVVCPHWLTVEGEVAKQCRDEVKQKAEANADICNVLHPGLSRSKRHEETVTGA